MAVRKIRKIDREPIIFSCSVERYDTIAIIIDIPEMLKFISFKEFKNRINSYRQQLLLKFE